MGHRLRPNSPELYHGTARSRPYFEGWYFKHTSDDAAFSVIAGIYRGADESGDTAFIQIIHGTPPTSRYVAFPVSAFKVRDDRFALWIGKNYFSAEKMILDIDALGIYATLDFSRRISLKTTCFSPSIMGPFSYLPAMQCNHGVVSLSHVVNGTAQLGDHSIIFKDADGYIEKDWGEAFPQRWIWMQCNDKEAALMCAVSTIPYGPLHFTGLICVLLADGKQFRFATYNGARVKEISSRGQRTTVVLKRQRYRLVITADNSAFGTLKAPTTSGMSCDIQESIDAAYHIELYHNKKLIFSADIEKGGLEMFDAMALMGKHKQANGE